MLRRARPPLGCGRGEERRERGGAHEERGGQAAAPAAERESLPVRGEKLTQREANPSKLEHSSAQPSDSCFLLDGNVLSVLSLPQGCSEQKGSQDPPLSPWGETSCPAKDGRL